MQARAAAVAGACCYGCRRVLPRLQARAATVAGLAYYGCRRCVLLEQACLVEEVDVLGPPLDALEALANGDGVLAAYRLLRRWRGEVRGEVVEKVGRVGR